MPEEPEDVGTDEPTPSAPETEDEWEGEEPEPITEEIQARYDDLVGQGVEAGEAGDYPRALELLDAAADLGVPDPEVHYNLGVLWGLLAMEDIKVTEFIESFADDEVLLEKAIFQYQQALDLDGEYYHALNNMATLYAVDGQTDMAVEALQRSLSINPDQPQVQEELHELTSI